MAILIEFAVAKMAESVHYF